MASSRKGLRAAATAALAAAALSVTACGTLGMGGMDGTDLPDDVNAADVMFVQMMIPHHEQAIVMADLVLDTDGIDPRVIDLADQIKAAQGPEISQMEQWLDDWGIPAMPDGHGGHGGMDGMLSDEELQRLDDAEGADATCLFLEGMIVHHEGAIDMARDLMRDGQNAHVRMLAEAIVASPQAEIDLMRDLLADL
jgi:uncharacterized protein (DUF305 family)